MEPRMKIDEPKTPFVHESSIVPLEDDGTCPRHRSDGRLCAGPRRAARGGGAGAGAARRDAGTHTCECADCAAHARAHGDEQRRARHGRAAQGPAGADRLGQGHRADARERGCVCACRQLTAEERRHAVFSEKRHQHYGNEAQALKMGAALMEQDDE